MRRITVWLLIVSMVSGCSMLGDSDQDVTNEAAPVVPSMGSSENTTEEAAATSEVASADVSVGSDQVLAAMETGGPAAACDWLSDQMGDDFCTDSDGNGWPDFAETAAGLDPLVDPCLTGECMDVPIETLIAQAQGNALVILDASGSMVGPVAGGTKMDQAKAALVTFVEGTPEFIDLGLMVYGHRGDNTPEGKPESCTGVEMIAEMGTLNASNVSATVDEFSATGWTPIAASLDAAGPVLADAVEADRAATEIAGNSRIILISDGIESCDGDPVASAHALVAQGFDVVVDVIGFDIAEGDRAALAQVAEVTGGVYTDVTNGDEIRGALALYQEQINALRRQIECLDDDTEILTSCVYDETDLLLTWSQEYAQSSDSEYDVVFVFEEWKDALWQGNTDANVTMVDQALDERRDAQDVLEQIIEASGDE